MSFISMLDHAGVVIKDFFVKELPVAEKVAVAAEPFVDLAFPGIAVLFNSTVSLVGQAQATGVAAAAGASTGPQKFAAVTSALEPMAIAYLKSQGINADATVIANWTNAFVALLKTIPAPAGSPAIPPAA